MIKRNDTCLHSSLLEYRYGKTNSMEHYITFLIKVYRNFMITNQTNNKNGLF